MTWILALKLFVILIFLIMFLRRPSVSWGIGLLTVTTALLLDALLGTFNGAALREELGFFYFVIAGSLFGGASIWLWGVLFPFVNPTKSQQLTEMDDAKIITGVQRAKAREDSIDGIDNKMLYEEIKNRFGREDIFDLMFDLNINENDVMNVDQDMNQLIINIMDITKQEGQTSSLAMAVERILTPPPANYLPRLEKISADSPPTILRQYLLAHYDLAELEQMTNELHIDWQQLDAGAKREKVRSLLQFLYRRNRVAEFVSLMHQTGLDEEE